METKKKEKIKVFIVDDDNMLIDGIARFFDDSKALEYLDRANNPEECLQKLKKQSSTVDIILMDVQFPEVETDGIQLAREIRNLYPGKKPRIAFMTISNKAIVDPDNGFHGLIPKNQGIVELMNMLENIYRKGTVYYPPETIQKHFIDTLTARQKKILCLTLKGVEVEKTAVKLNISKETAISHQKIIISKLQPFGIKVKHLNHPKIKTLAQQFNICDQLII